MSWQAVDWVMRHSPTTGTDRLVQLAIAEQSRDEEPVQGCWRSYPGMKRIASYAGLVNERTAQASIKRMTAKKVLIRADGPAWIRADRRPNLYGIPVSAGVCCGFSECSVCEGYGVRPESPRKEARGALRQHAGCATTANGVSDSASRGAPGITRTLSNPMNPVEPSSSSFEIEKPKTRSNIDQVAAHYITEYGHLGCEGVEERMEIAGYVESDIHAVLAIMQKTRRSA